MSFLVWRALRNKLPTIDKIITFGQKAAACSCCTKPGVDTSDHLFVSGSFANHLWNIFSNSLGISHKTMPSSNLLMRWWCVKHHTEVHRLILQTLPSFLCWNLWKNRCANKYGGKKSSSARVRFAVVKDIHMQCSTAVPYISWPLDWRVLIQQMEKCQHEVKVIQVCWTKPAHTRVKLNTDGSALNNPGKYRGWRDTEGSCGQFNLCICSSFGDWN